jgi:hypothetical protein
VKSYDDFKKSFLSFRYDNIKMPRIIKKGRLDVPYNTSIHFISDALDIHYPSKNFIDGLVKGGMRYLYTVGAHYQNLNIMGKSEVTMGSLINQCKQETPYLKPCLDDVKASSNKNAVIIYNYGLLTPSVRYRKKASTPYARWLNIRSTVWEKANDAINQTGNYQIIPINLPCKMPTYEDYLKIDKSEKIPLIHLKTWSNEEALDIQDIIRFLGTNREYSNLNLIEEKNYGKVLICFKLNNGNVVYYNLGDIVSFIKTKDNTKGKTDNTMMQKYFLRMVNYLIDYNEKSLSDMPHDEGELGTSEEEVNLDEVTDAPTTQQEQDKQETVSEKIARLRLKNIEKRNKVEDISKNEVPLPEETEKDYNEILEELEEQNKENDIFNLLLQKEREEDEDEYKFLSKFAKVSKGKMIKDDDLDIQLEDGEEATEADQNDLTFNDKTISVLPSLKDNSRIIIDTNVPDIEKGVVAKALELMKKGVLTGNEASRMAKLSQSYKRIKSPFGNGETLEQLAKMDMAELNNLEPAKIPDLITVPNKALLESKLPNFEKVYIEKYLNKQIACSILGIQKSGIAVTDYKVESIKNASDDYQHLTISVVPPLGKPTDIHIKIPTIRPDGTYKSNGSVFRMRNQRSDVPIRKTKADEVKLDSYYGKIYLNRGRKQSQKLDIKLFQAIKKQKNNPDSKVTISYVTGDASELGTRYPRDYSGLSQYLVSLLLDGTYQFIFDQINLKEVLAENSIQVDESQFVVGYNTKSKKPLYMDNAGNVNEEDNKIGSIGTLVGIDTNKIPKDQAYMEIYGTSIPTGLILSYYYGIHGLLNATGINYDISTKRVTSTPTLGVIKFADCYLTYDTTHKSSAIFNSLTSIAKILKDKLFMELEDKENYNRLFTLCGFNIGHLTEIDNLPRCFIDSITEERLIQMGEPKEFTKLLIRGCEMLKDDYHLEGHNFNEQIIRGYERIPGIIHEQLSKSIRSYYGRTPTKRSKLAIDNYAVWNAITNDPTIIQTENLNPIHNLKEKESITFTGTGGRKKDTLTRPTRVFLDTDKGVISDATKDSSDVGIEAVMVASPKIKNYLGFTERFDDEKDNAANMLSTTALLYPFSDLDDPTRVNFINIQASSGIMAVGNIASPIRTGMETVISHRVDKLYAFTAVADGIIKEKSDTHILVEYNDNQYPNDYVTLGIEYGKAKGCVYPHNIISDREAGYVFKAGECLAYNTGFFERDIIEPTQVVYKGATIGRITFLEAIETDEDSTIPSASLADKLQTYSTDIKDIVVEFTDDIRNMKKVGDKVELGDILCNIVNKTVADAELFSEQSLNLLNDVSADSPKCKHTGEITRIECFYNGEIENMSDSLKKIALKSDDYCRKQSKRTLGDYHKSGLVTNDFKVGGQRLERDRACIRIYITGLVRAGAGDKATVGGQVKTTFADVIRGRYSTLRDGKEVDLLNSYLAPCNRKVKSMELMGMAITLCKVQCEKVCKDYFND